MIACLTGMSLALLTVLFSMLLSSNLKQILGRTGLNIMSKMSGLILAADIFFTGVMGYPDWYCPSKIYTRDLLNGIREPMYSS